MQAPGRILIVDDNDINRDILAKQLAGRGLVTDTAESGEACLAKLGASAYDAVLLDIDMPGMDGLEVIARIRETWSADRLPVLFVTGMSRAQDVVKGLEAGANDYMTKPVHSAVLFARLSVALKMKRSIDTLIEAEQQRVMIASVTAACHHLAQPLTKISLALAFLVKDMAADRPEDSQKLEDMRRWTEQVGEMLQRLRQTTEFRTVPYTQDVEMLDIGVYPHGDRTRADTD